MKDFKIIFLKPKKYLVIELNTNNLVEYYPELRDELINIEAKGMIYIDSLLSIGFKKDRYKNYIFNGDRLKSCSFGGIKPPEYVKQDSLDFFQNHPEIISNAVLTTKDIEKLTSQFYTRRKNK